MANNSTGGQLPPGSASAPGIEYAKASDREELLGFLLNAFNRDRPNADHSKFDDLYPDLFLADDSVMGRHAVIREEGRIVACVGAYLMPLRIGSEIVMTAGFGQVSTDAAFLGRGFMSALLKHQLQRVRREGAILAWLGGRRDRYSHFGFDSAGVTVNHLIDTHSLGSVPRRLKVAGCDARQEGAITPEMFKLREGTAQSVLEPFETFKIQLGRKGFALEVWTASQDGKEPEAWALFDSSHRRVIEWCGSFDGRIEILAALCERGAVERTETRGDAEMLAFLREHCLWCTLESSTIAVLDAARLLEAMAPFVPAGFEPKETGGPALARELFGPWPGSPLLPFHIPRLFHV